MDSNQDQGGRVVSLIPKQLADLKCRATMGRPYADRISLMLASRLLDKSDRYFDPFAVLDELDHLEGMRASSVTKRESQFKLGGPLHPLWHKHFTLPRHLIHNIGIRWNLSGGGNKDLDNMIEEVLREHGEFPERWQALLTHRFVIDAFKDRAARGLTGDWIIYGKHDDLNYYLDLATHSEAVGQKAVQLLKKLRGSCMAEFPFVFAEQEARSA